MKLACLTGGGDCPGLNAVIRGITVKAIGNGHEVIGYRRGWAGVLDGESMALTLDAVEDIHRTGGTILRTSRTNLPKVKDGFDKAEATLKRDKVDVLIAIGGEDTLGVANKLYQEKKINTIGVPKTIDNDLSATDYTFGYDTAINIATESFDRVHTTANSHERILVVEVMGRHAGWMTLEAGIAGGAHVILLPEEKFDINEVVGILKKRQETGKGYSIVAVSEGAQPKDLEGFVTQDTEKDSFGHVKLGGVGQMLAKQLEKLTGQESRHVVLGHLQRGGSPTAFDRVLGTRLGVKAVESAEQNKFGVMVALRGTDIVCVPLADAVTKLKTVPKERYEEAKIFFGQ